MRLPFIWREDHDTILRQANMILCDRDTRIAELILKIKVLEGEKAALIEELASTPPIRESIQRERKPPVPLVGRSGWRAKAAQRSKETIPAPKDSSKALEEKVIREGGIV
jgi:hypothetical protein